MRKRLSRRQARRDLHIKTNAKVVLFLGRLQDNKGVQLLLKALPQQAIALIAGNGPLLDKLKEHAQQLGVNARFEGAVPPSRHATLFAAADVLAIPSFADVHGHAEGLPSVMLEAFAHGVPVVASHIGGIPEVLQHEQHGLLVRPGSVDDLRQALLRMLNDQHLQQRCRRAISALAQRYTPRAQAELLLRLCTSQHR
jgi:glycosyltransferase involved in cell wall biosynthesis